jgi:hypothetical protein
MLWCVCTCCGDIRMHMRTSDLHINYLMYVCIEGKTESTNERNILTYVRSSQYSYV